jgi:hypothetical protein
MGSGLVVWLLVIAAAVPAAAEGRLPCVTQGNDDRQGHVAPEVARPHAL